MYIRETYTNFEDRSMCRICIHTYTRTYILSYIHTCIHTNKQYCIYTFQNFDKKLKNFSPIRLVFLGKLSALTCLSAKKVTLKTFADDKTFG